MINRSGTTFVHRAIEETGAEVAQITRAYTVVREVFGLEKLWAEIEALDNQVSTEAQHAGYQEIRRLIDRATRWFVDVRFPITRRRRRDRAVRPDAGRAGPAHHRRCVRGAELADIESESQRLVGARPAARAGAAHLAELLSTFLLLDVVEIANAPARTRRPRSPSCTSRCPTSSTSTRC